MQVKKKFPVTGAFVGTLGLSGLMVWLSAKMLEAKGRSPRERMEGEGREWMGWKGKRTGMGDENARGNPMRAFSSPIPLFLDFLKKINF
jgi:hypothetical protein